MTEAEWCAIEDWQPIRDILMDRDGRKCRLFGVACVRSVAVHFTSTDRAIFQDYESLVDANDDGRGLRALRRKLHKRFPSQVRLSLISALSDDAVLSGSTASWHAVTTAASRATVWVKEYSQRPAVYRAAFNAQTLLHWQFFHDIFNPFRPVTFSPTWLSSTAVAIAQAIYEGRAFDRLPILADALQDAGCEDEQVLGHCRGEGPHVRGCWVVDGVLGKK